MSFLTLSPCPSPPFLCLFALLPIHSSESPSFSRMSMALSPRSSPNTRRTQNSTLPNPPNHRYSKLASLQTSRPPYLQTTEPPNLRSPNLPNPQTSSLQRPEASEPQTPQHQVPTKQTPQDNKKHQKRQRPRRKGMISERARRYTPISTSPHESPKAMQKRGSKWKRRRAVQTYQDRLRMMEAHTIYYCLGM